MYALFEALACEPFLERNGLLSIHFDEVFELVQTNKPLTVAHYIPAMTSFAFDKSLKRSTWAMHSWRKVTAKLTESDFDFAVRGPLARELDVILMAMPDSKGVEHFWHAMKPIVEKLAPDLITHSLRSMEQNVYLVGLDHLQVDSPGLGILLQCFEILLTQGPSAFWQAVGTMAPTAVVERIFNCPRLKTTILSVSTVEQAPALQHMLSWIEPFMKSLQTPHKPPACRSITSQLLTRFQKDEVPTVARERCFQTGVEVLAQTLTECNKDAFVHDAVGRIAATDTLGILWDYLEEVISRSKDGHCSNTLQGICVSTLEQTVRLEANLLRADRVKIMSGARIPSGYRPYVPAFWEVIEKHLKRGYVGLTQIVMSGLTDLIGLEKIESKRELPHPQEQKSFNSIVENLSQTLTATLDRVADFDPQHLDSLTKSSAIAPHLMSPLFSSEQAVSEAGANLLKNMCGATVRREAISSFLSLWPRNILASVVFAIKRIAQYKAFAPCPRMLKVCTDVVDLLCNSQDGLLRTTALFADCKDAVRSYWAALWETLNIIYKQTEPWSQDIRVAIMSDFCRDVMQFSERLGEDFSVFDSATKATEPTETGSGASPAGVAIDGDAAELLLFPSRTLLAMIKYLKLRDEYLLSTSVGLIQKLLMQLSSKNMILGGDASAELTRLTTSKQKITNMTEQQKAEVLRALEENLGHPIAIPRMDDEKPIASGRDNKTSLKQGSIDIGSWAQKSGIKSDIDDDILCLSPSVELLKARQKSQTPMPPRGQVGPKPASLLADEKKKEADKAAFLKSREREKQDRMRRNAEIAAKRKKDLMPNSMAGQTSGEGSALAGLGNLGKEAKPKGTGIMVSSGESESEASDDGFDRELFGSPMKSKEPSIVAEYRASKLKSRPQGPVKKQRQVRNQKDMRARVAPNLDTLHQAILAWDFFHDGDFPPESRRDEYKLVASRFNNAMDYRATFESLLKLEAWQGFRQAREEGNARSFKLETKSRMSLDNLIEISSTIDPAILKERGIGEGDILLLSKDSTNVASANEPNCLGRVSRITRKAGTVELAFRIAHRTPMNDYLGLNVGVRAEKITSVIPLEREYSALLGLMYYDLCDEIVKAYPSPLLSYSEQSISKLSRVYDLNAAQSKAVLSAVDNDAFTLIQGPPGSGKTKTIVAIVGALLTDVVKKPAAVPIAVPLGPQSNGVRSHSSSIPKKLLVCAPSNAAVDELVMRFMQGIRTTDGALHKASILRLGRSESINPKVLEVTLDELVKERMGSVASKSAEDDDIHKVMQQHKAAHEQLIALRANMDERAGQGLSATVEQSHELEVLKQKKTSLSNQIDRMKDGGNTRERNTDIKRTRIRQEILNGAHIICATLSGSGHDMFRHLSIDFETVIIDEAAQSIEVSALIPLKYGCSKCIMVGDPKQLPPTVLSREAARFQYEQSLFVRMQTNHPEMVHLLDTQYRMHPEISVFPSQAFYDGRLVDGPGMAAARARPWHSDELLGPYRFFDVQGMHESAPKGHSLVNKAEADIALRLFQRLRKYSKSFDLSGKVGIITPYKSQLGLLRDRFRAEFGESIQDTIDFNTTDAFQGRESEVIIFSCVRASQRGIGFLSDIRRMNVGITRAKSSLWVLGNSSSLGQGEYWSRLIEDAQRRNKFTTETSRILHGSIPSGPRSTPQMLTGRNPHTDGLPTRRLEALSARGASNAPDVPMPDAPPIVRSSEPSNDFRAPKVSAPSGMRMDVDVKAEVPSSAQSVQPHLTAARRAISNEDEPPVHMARVQSNNTSLGARDGTSMQRAEGEDKSRPDGGLSTSVEATKGEKVSKPDNNGPRPSAYRIAKPPIPRKPAADSVFIKPKRRK